MADEFDYDDSEFMDYDDGWMYVEDEYGLADELAETQIADPGYAGTNNEIEMEDYEYDLYNYWDDMEYGDDAYWDYDGRPPSTVPSSDKVGAKRKRGAPAKTSVDKRRKVSAIQRAAGDTHRRPGQNVLYMSAAERYAVGTRPAPMLKGKSSSAFLPDWRKRFAGMDGIVRSVKVPSEMRKAAQADEETPPKNRHVDIEALGEEEGDWEDEDAEGQDGGVAGLDPEMLKTILKQRLGEAGLEGMDEEAFMSSITKMLAGEEADDDVTAELANMLLGRATADHGDEAASQWLSQQGVSLENAEGEEDETADSGVYIASDATEPAGPTTQMAMHGSSPKRPQKRQKKRKSVKFDVPNEVEDEQEEAAIVDGDENENVLPTPPSSEDTTTVVSKTAAKATKSKAANSKAVEVNNAANVADAGNEMATPDEQLGQELRPDVLDVQAAASEHTGRQARKRKAEAELDHDDTGEERADSRAVKGATTKRTRSARAAQKVGK